MTGITHCMKAKLSFYCNTSYNAPIHDVKSDYGLFLNCQLERLAPMDVHLKYNSKALTGRALHYTSTSHWSSRPTSGHESPISAFTGKAGCSIFPAWTCDCQPNWMSNFRVFPIEEENGHFTLPGFVGKVVTEQLQQGNVVRVTTSGRR